ncbi:high affinity immunoglobulin epsilon receptor subunit beta [Rhinolophus sinicus]|uniref:high affinity immunoglobulin epsilon receptor subunit beta n=1 Tax=Rhinolophus sinicus TaxID=89399 RepID=UPI003D797803
MDTESRGRAGLALPSPQEPSNVSEIELSEAPFHDSALLEKPAPPPPPQTWRTFLKRELEFLGVTQILIGLICLCFGTFVFSMLKISEFERDLFSSFKAGFPFWGALLFTISGVLSIMTEKKDATYLMRGSLGASLVSSIAAGTGIVILVINLKSCLAYTHFCQKDYEDEFCVAACFSIEIVAMILFLTILGFGVAVLLTLYRVGELFKGKIPEDVLYEELNIYSPIYSELEERGETASPTDS